MRSFTLGSIAVRVGIVLLCVLWFIPTLGLLISSFRDEADVKSSGWWTVITDPFSQWTFDSYSQVLESGMANAFVNSIVVSVPATVLPIMIAAFAAYAFTFMRFPGRNVLFMVIVGLLVVPLQVAFVPLLNLFGSYDLNGTFLAVWLAHTAFGMPLAVFILRSYMATLPQEIIESAEIDGASHFQTFWRLIVPMSVPVIAAFAILQFLWVWNDLLIAKLFLSTDNATVIVKLQGLLGSQGQGSELLPAGAFISMVIPMVVFFTLQRFFVRGLTSGAVKG